MVGTHNALLLNIKYSKKLLKNVNIFFRLQISITEGYCTILDNSKEQLARLKEVKVEPYPKMKTGVFKTVAQDRVKLTVVLDYYEAKGTYSRIFQSRIRHMYSLSAEGLVGYILDTHAMPQPTCGKTTLVSSVV